MKPFVETDRLFVRPFAPDDLPVIHRILDATFDDGSHANDQAALEERRSWLQWSMLSQEWFPKLYQPPYGDQAIVLKENGQLIGSIGYVPCLHPFAQVPSLRGGGAESSFLIPEVGLFWAIDPQVQRRGYATEAARAMVEQAFSSMNLRRIVATTEYDNIASQGVMRAIGMRIERNPLPEPVWFQVVGVLDRPAIL